jgi:hypothetical protein
MDKKDNTRELAVFRFGPGLVLVFKARLRGWMAPPKELGLETQTLHYDEIL